MISLVAMMQDGAAIETATLAREAILGALSALGSHTAGMRAIAQIDATAWRMPVADFRPPSAKVLSCERWRCWAVS